MRGDLADLLAEGGAVVGGRPALGGVVGFIAGSLVNDLGRRVDPDQWARRFGMLGGVAGLVALIDHWH